MYTEKALEHFDNMWDKDEESFHYCLNLLKEKLTLAEFNQMNLYYYIQNGNLEKAAEYLFRLKKTYITDEKIIMKSDSDDFAEDCLYGCLVGECCGSVCEDVTNVCNNILGCGDDCCGDGCCGDNCQCDNPCSCLCWSYCYISGCIGLWACCSEWHCISF